MVNSGAGVLERGQMSGHVPTFWVVPRGHVRTALCEELDVLYVTRTSR